ncbi:Octanoyltransferase [Metarhizium album ARSEF 1941]|uniref:lipoyl(octanoyl) transferase n=1 Tax=Metarhizium album (strain ARSEF 1941) TaxID=1081103 RepID=A0A0B2WVN3_METAS|nr:Octanoyltransferase [Metarhizium album ARSEF 1941]KHO00187.1 Octanoyltransferase [Metarhizium album ARSEF 1941]
MWRATLPCGLPAAAAASLSGCRAPLSRQGWSRTLLMKHALGLPRRLSILEHVHLKGDPSTGLVAYEHAEDAQEQHRARFLRWKALSEEQRTSASHRHVPRPRLMSFEATPTFTLGRRQEDLTAEQARRLQQPLDIGLVHRRNPISRRFTPQVRKTNRGGLTTYHGPGQIVLWPIIDMHSSAYPKYGVASYANHLETTTQRLLSGLFGIHTYTTRDEPGVWVKTSSGQERKIAALGVHHRRYVTALGIAVNIDVPVAGGEAVNPWARFVPCGLDGRSVTSVAAEVGVDSALGWDLEDLAGRWASLFEEGLADEATRSAGDGEPQSRLQR